MRGGWSQSLEPKGARTGLGLIRGFFPSERVFSGPFAPRHTGLRNFCESYQAVAGMEDNQ